MSFVHMSMHQHIDRHDAPTHYERQANPENACMHRKTRANIKDLMVKHQVASERALAIACQMSQSTLHRFLKGETETLEFHHIKALAKYFSLTVSQLIGETPFEPDQKARIVAVAMQAMPEYQKDVVVATSLTLNKLHPHSEDTEKMSGTHH